MEDNGYDTSNCHIISRGKNLKEFFSKEISKLPINESANVLYRAGAHWSLINYSRDQKGKLSLVWMDSQASSPNDIYTILPRKVGEEIGVYVNDLSIQKRDGCGVFSSTFLQYVINNGASKFLENIKSKLVEYEDESEDKNINIFKYNLPDQCITLCQDPEIVKTSKDVIVKPVFGDEFANKPMELEDYVNVHRTYTNLKGKLSKTPSKYKNKPVTKMLNYIRSKYLKESYKIMEKLNFNIEKISQIVANHHIYNPKNISAKIANMVETTTTSQHNSVDELTNVVNIAGDKTITESSMLV
ncbi:MAG: hypothetical protein HRU35_00340 [Rickettsiaceae bacterium]|nr:hypothetical protein [Rickettsiaceae bacterium]